MKKSLVNAIYPPNWSEIASEVKKAAGNRCARCRHPAEMPWKLFPKLWSWSPCDEQCRHSADGKQRVLTVHHLDMNPANCAWWNIPPLCQACHLSVQGRYHLHQYWLMRPPAWLAPYVKGFKLWTITGITVVNVKLLDFDQYIGRPNRWLRQRYPGRDLRNVWANPYKVSAELPREKAIELYRARIVELLRRDPNTYDLAQLVGKRIGCFCKPEPCHGDVLPELVAEYLISLTTEGKYDAGAVLDGRW